MKIAYRIALFNIWTKIAKRNPFPPLDAFINNRLRRAFYGLRAVEKSVWTLCPEGGGSNFTVYGERAEAVNIAAKMGIIRYVDDKYKFLIYKP